VEGVVGSIPTNFTIYKNPVQYDPVLNFLLKYRKELLNRGVEAKMNIKIEYKDDQYVITAIEGMEMMNHDDSIILLDVRTKEEYMNEHIENSVLIPVTEMFESILTLCPDQKITYLIYCRSGVRSVYARQIMKHLGYHHVFDMGGIIDWPFKTISSFE